MILALLKYSLLAAIVTSQIGCAVDTEVPIGEIEADAGASDSKTQPDFSALQERLERALAENPDEVPGMGLVVFNQDDERVFEASVGSFDFDERLAVASASKLISGLVLMHTVNEGTLSLQSTTGQILGWQGPRKSSITLDHLGAFVSGLVADPPCALRPNMTLETCVDEIAMLTLQSNPGNAFAYGSGHLHTAGRMAEVATGKGWNALAQDGLFASLGLNAAELEYTTLPQLGVGRSNPLVAGGLQATTNEYAMLLRLLFHKGKVGDNQLIDASLIERFGANPYAEATIAYSPMADAGLNFGYSFGAWLDCEDAAASCGVISSTGTFGFSPWVDWDKGYYAILAMEAPQSGAGAYSAVVVQELKALLEVALPAS